MVTPPRAPRSLAGRPGGEQLAVDGALAALVFLVATGPLLVGWSTSADPLPTAALGLAVAAPLTVRRWAPELTLAAVSVALVTATASDVAFTPWTSNAGPALALATGTVAHRLPARRALAWAAAAVLLVTGAQVMSLDRYPGDQNAVHLVSAAPAWLAGWLLGAASSWSTAWPMSGWGGPVRRSSGSGPRSGPGCRPTCTTSSPTPSP